LTGQRRGTTSLWVKFEVTFFEAAFWSLPWVPSEKIIYGNFSKGEMSLTQAVANNG
jgi:hypothetical protein